MDSTVGLANRVFRLLDLPAVASINRGRRDTGTGTVPTEHGGLTCSASGRSAQGLGGVGPAAGDGGHPLQQRPLRHLRLSHPGQEPELAGERTAAGRRAQPPRGRPADHAQRAARPPRRPASPTERTRAARRADPPGPRAVPQPVGRRRGHAGRIPQPVGPQARGRLAHGRQPAGMGDGAQDRGRPGSGPPGQPRSRLDARRRQARPDWKRDWSGCKRWPPSCPATCTPRCAGLPPRCAGSTAR